MDTRAPLARRATRSSYRRRWSRAVLEKAARIGRVRGVAGAVWCCLSARWWWERRGGEETEAHYNAQGGTRKLKAQKRLGLAMAVLRAPQYKTARLADPLLGWHFLWRLKMVLQVCPACRLHGRRKHSWCGADVSCSSRGCPARSPVRLDQNTTTRPAAPTCQIARHTMSTHSLTAQLQTSIQCSAPQWRRQTSLPRLHRALLLLVVRLQAPRQLRHIGPHDAQRVCASRSDKTSSSTRPAARMMASSQVRMHACVSHQEPVLK